MHPAVPGVATQRLDKCAIAELAFDEIRLPPHPILREHHLLAHIQEAPGGVEADKSQATGDQNHGASSTGISTSSPAFVICWALHTLSIRINSHVGSIAQIRNHH